MNTSTEQALEEASSRLNRSSARDMGELAPGMLEVRVLNGAAVDDALAEAIEQVQEAAANHGTGIMVTRIGAGRYIVRANPAVPYGLVRQRHE